MNVGGGKRDVNKKKIDKKRKKYTRTNAFPVMIDYDISRVRVFDIIYPPRPPRVHVRTPVLFSLVNPAGHLIAPRPCTCYNTACTRRRSPCDGVSSSPSCARIDTPLCACRHLARTQYKCAACARPGRNRKTCNTTGEGNSFGIFY